MTTRKIVLTLALTALIAILVPGIALANVTPHGGYTQDTDACAGCHRAHDSYSSATWTNGDGDQRSALLIGDSATMWEFCYTCHGTGAQGAETDVEDGRYNGSAYGDSGAMLNGGGFGRPGDGEWTSTHIIGGGWGAYGGGPSGQETSAEASSSPIGASSAIDMDCGTCHNPHGSPNYRLLVTQITLDGQPLVAGSYTGPNADQADAWVQSVERGFPISGFDKGVDYGGSYIPNYTTPMYAKGYPQSDVATDTIAYQRGMSGWCSRCHTQYIGNAESRTSTDTPYNVGDGQLIKRHRHPVNSNIENYTGQDAITVTDLNEFGTIDPGPLEYPNSFVGVPIAHDMAEKNNAIETRVYDDEDWIECLSCHRAHGTKATMEGWSSEATMAAIGAPYWGSEISALLRHDNRGTCQRCHQK